MKKFIPFVAVLLITMTLLVGCGTAAEEVPASPTPKLVVGATSENYALMASPSPGAMVSDNYSITDTTLEVASISPEEGCMTWYVDPDPGIYALRIKNNSAHNLDMKYCRNGTDLALVVPSGQVPNLANTTGMTITQILLWDGDNTTPDPEVPIKWTGTQWQACPSDILEAP